MTLELGLEEPEGDWQVKSGGRTFKERRELAPKPGSREQGRKWGFWCG